MTRKKKPASLDDLTPEQRDALVEFATKNGRCWRDKLAAGWLKAAYPGPLQQIRNQFGPSWLYEMRLGL